MAVSKKSSGGVGYVIRNYEDRMLAAGGSFLFKPFIPSAELQAIWMGITHAQLRICAERIVVEGDLATVIVWIRDAVEQFTVHPLIHDIRKSLHHFSMTIVRYVYWEANNATD